MSYELDPAIAAELKRWDNEPPPPPLSEKQKDIIAAAFRGAIKRPGTGPPAAEAPGGEPGARSDTISPKPTAAHRQPVHERRR